MNLAAGLPPAIASTHHCLWLQLRPCRFLSYLWMWLKPAAVGLVRSRRVEEDSGKLELGEEATQHVLQHLQQPAAESAPPTRAALPSARMRPG